MPRKRAARAGIYRSDLHERPARSIKAAAASTPPHNWTACSCACASAGVALRNATGIKCEPSAFCCGHHADSAAPWPPAWPRSACLFSSLHVSPEGLRPWHQRREDALFTEFKSWRHLLSSLARARVRPRMYTLVRQEDIPRTWGYNTSAVPVRATHPSWASEWHRQSFIKLAVPRVARRLGCGVALFLDNDALAVRNLDDIFRVEPPAMAWHHEWHRVRGSVGPRLNSGVMLLPTDLAFVEALEAYTARIYSEGRFNRTVPRHMRDGSDQEVWQGFFAESGRHVNELPAAFNARKTMRLNTSAIVVAHLIRGDDDGDEALRAAHFLPPGALDRPMVPDIEASSPWAHVAT